MYGACGYNIMAAIHMYSLVLQNKETTAMLVYRTNPLRVKLFSYVKTFFCSNKFSWLLDMWVHYVLFGQMCKVN